MKRKINRIVVHCSATQPLKQIGAATIDRWHRKQGWLEIGYHFVIRTTGGLEFGRDIEDVGAHAKGYNADSIAICLIGGVDENGTSVNNFFPSQFRTLKTLIRMLWKLIGEEVEVVGHRDLPGVKKDCPCFDVSQIVEEIHEEDAPRIQPLS